MDRLPGRIVHRSTRLVELVECSDDQRGRLVGDPREGRQPAADGWPGRSRPPRAAVSPTDRAEIERIWNALLAAMTAQDEAAIVKLGAGCKAGPRAFWSSLPPDMTPPANVPAAKRNDPRFKRAWRSRLDRLPEMSASWAAGGITLDEIRDDAVGGFIGPAMPAMTGITFERDRGGRWSICKMTPGD